MKVHGYIRISGQEDAIKYLGRGLHIEGICIKHLTKVAGKYSVTGEDAPWILKTAPKEISSQNLDIDLHNMMMPFSQQYLKIKSAIKTPVFVELQLVVEYDDGDPPIGMAFSDSTIRLLSKIEAALDVDAISY